MYIGKECQLSFQQQTRSVRTIFRNRLQDQPAISILNSLLGKAVLEDNLIGAESLLHAKRYLLGQ